MSRSFSYIELLQRKNDATAVRGPMTNILVADEATVKRWRGQFQEVYNAIIACRTQFYAWFEEAKTTERKTDEIHRLIEEIITHEQDYEVWIKDLPRVEDFTAEELQGRNGEVGRLYAIGDEIIRLGADVEMKLAKLRYLVDGNHIQ